MIRDNLIYNPSFKNGTTGWAAFTSGSITAETNDSFIGDACVRFTKSSTSDDAGVFSAAGYKVAATAGNIYSASAYVKVPTGQETIQVRASFRWYDSGGSFLSGTAGTLTTITSTDGWIRLTTQNAAAPASTAFADVVIYQDAGTKTIGNYFLVDAVKLENSAISTQFIETRDQSEENKKVNIGLTPMPIPHITGMQLNADIMLNDIVFNTIDENNVVWICSDIEGWWNLPDSEVQDLTRGLDDGSYDVRGRYGARNLTFTGSLLCPDPASAAVARNKLIEAIDLIHKGGWLLVAEDPTKATFVRLSGRPEIRNTKARGRIDFSIGLRAANPIKYAWNWEDPDGYETTAVSNGSSAVLGNDGNTNVPIVFTISGGTSTNLTAPITINNTTLDQTLTVVKDLRSAAYSVNVTRSERAGNVVTLTTAGHDFYIGDTVSVENISIVIPITRSERTGTTVTLTTAGHSFIINDVVTIANVTTAGRTGLNEASRTITGVTATTITYTSATGGTLADAVTNGGITLVGADNRSSLNKAAATVTDTTANTVTYVVSTSGTLVDAVTSGTIGLDSADTLEVDTYNKTALFNGSAFYDGGSVSARSWIDPLVDWIVLKPGDNTITFTDSGGTTDLTVKYRSGWIG